MTLRHPFSASLIICLLLIAPFALAQESVISEDDPWCEDRHGHWSDDDSYEYCEIREIELSQRDGLDIDAAPNGSIAVRSWDEDGILVRAKIGAHARSDEAARELAEQVSISTSGSIEADGPRTGNKEWFSVSFEIYAPASTNLDLSTRNGGISIEGMSGRTEFQSLNGGVSLNALSGDVSGTTTNGGITVDLDGDSWSGRGLDVETTNGGVSVLVPNGYSAQLETGTVNGRVDIDFPVMVEGTFDDRLSTTLGDGGKTIRVVTTNGSVRIKRG